MPEPPSSIDQLLALPPGEFIAARNRLAGELKKRDPEQAATIKALPKPSRPVTQRCCQNRLSECTSGC